MVEEIKKLESPIDVMFLMHKALSAEALKVERIIQNYEPGTSLQPFVSAFNEWATALMYHADVEDEYMTLPLPNFQPARDNETEHAELHALGGDLVALLEDQKIDFKARVQKVMAALTEEQHSQLLTGLQDVLDVLGGEIGRGTVIPRTARHLYTKVVNLRATQDDHFENEEAFVLQEVRNEFGYEKELDLARRLMFDESSDDKTWFVDWMKEHLTDGEVKLLDALAEEANKASATAAD
jgi:hypothetical protein